MKGYVLKHCLTKNVSKGTAMHDGAPARTALPSNCAYDTLVLVSMSLPNLVCESQCFTYGTVFVTDISGSFSE